MVTRRPRWMSRFWSRSVDQWWKDWWKQTKGQLVWEGELYCRQFSLPSQWPQGPSSFASYASLTQRLVSNCRVHPSESLNMNTPAPFLTYLKNYHEPREGAPNCVLLIALRWQGVLLWLISPLPWMWVSPFIKCRHCPRPQVFNLCSGGKRSMSRDPS